MASPLRQRQPTQAVNPPQVAPSPRRARPQPRLEYGEAELEYPAGRQQLLQPSRPEPGPYFVVPNPVPLGPVGPPHCGPPGRFQA